jgi:antitoxin component YwqK of YwqJK toxin-antitoxin module
VEFYENGQKSFQGNYAAGQLDGLWIGWAEDGHQTGRFVFERGVIKTGD